MALLFLLAIVLLVHGAGPMYVGFETCNSDSTPKIELEGEVEVILKYRWQNGPCNELM